MWGPGRRGRAEDVGGGAFVGLGRLEVSGDDAGESDEGEDDGGEGGEAVEFCCAAG